MRENKREVARYSDKEFLLAPKTEMLARLERRRKRKDGKDGRTERDVDHGKTLF